MPPTASLASATEALSSVENALAEWAETLALARFIEQDEYEDPFEFADAFLNNLPAIAYALDAGLPVIEWGPAQVNVNQQERVLRSVRQWSERARGYLLDLADGRLTTDQFYDLLVATFRQQARNAYVAGRRSVGVLAELGTEQDDEIDELISGDVARLAALGGTSIGALIASMLLDPTNYFGSGLPGDPFAPKHAAKAAAEVGAFTRSVDEFGNSLRAMGQAGAMGGITDSFSAQASIVYWSLGPADHCIDCIRLADMSPFYAETLSQSGIYPGSGHTLCGGRCVPGGMVVAGSVTGGYRMRYRGELVELETSEGRRLSVTPNHPVLTTRGFVMAGLLYEGDELVCYREQVDGVTAPDEGIHHNDAPAPVEQVFRALQQMLPTTSRRPVGDDFYGEGGSLHGVVEVVGAARPLRDHIHTTCPECGGDLALVAADGSDLSTLAPDSLPLAGGRGGRTAAGSVVRRSDDVRPLALAVAAPRQPVRVGTSSQDQPSSSEPLAEGASRDASLSSQSQQGLTLQVPRRQRPEVRDNDTQGHDGQTALLGYAAQSHARLSQPAGQSPVADTDLLRQIVDGSPGAVAFDQVRHIERRQFDGDVYDLSTTGGWFTAGEVIIANCYCMLEYEIPKAVCGDSLSSVDSFLESARNAPLVESPSGDRINVWVQEAASCELPIQISQLNPEGEYDVIDDADAFNWNDDVHGQITGGSPADTVAWQAIAQQVNAMKAGEKILAPIRSVRKLHAMFSPVADLDPASLVGAQLSAYRAHGATYHAVWRQTTDAVRFEVGAVTDGLTVLEPEFTMRALRDLAAKAQEQGLRLEVNGATAGPGMRKWLETTGAEHLSALGAPPTITVDWPVAGLTPSVPTVALSNAPAEVSRLPAWPEMSALKDDAPQAVEALGGIGAKGLMIDPAGGRWLIKNEGAPAEVAAARLAEALGMRVPPVRGMTMGELLGEQAAKKLRPEQVAKVTASMQPMVPNARSLMQIGKEAGADSWAAALDNADAFARLTPAQAGEVVRQSVLDFVIANSDTHLGNWIIDDADNLWGIDRNLALGNALHATSTNPQTFWRHNGLFGVSLEDADTSKLLLNTRPADVIEALNRLDAMPNEEFLALIGEGAMTAPMFGGIEGGAKNLLERKANARKGYSQLFEETINKLGVSDNVSPEWRAWFDEGATFVTGEPIGLAAQLPVPAALPEGPAIAGTRLLPPTSRSITGALSDVGNNLARWQDDFVMATTSPEAHQRLFEILHAAPDRGASGFSLPQLNAILARAEALRARGVHMDVVRGLRDWTAVPAKAVGNDVAGLTVDGTIALKHNNRWAIELGEGIQPTVYDDIGGLFAHETGHAVYTDLTPAAQERLLELYARVGPRAGEDLSTYATTGVDEWFGEAFARITAPGYGRGQIDYDEELWSLLAADGKVTALPATLRLRPGMGPNFRPPDPTTLKVVPLPPGKAKLGGLSQKAIYAGPDGREWLVKPKKAFVDDVTQGRAAIEVEAAVEPLATALGVNISGVAPTTIEFPWKVGDPLKEVGASIQPIIPGLDRLPMTAGDELHAAGVAFDELTPDQLNDLAGQQVFDWLIGNDDGHIGQFLIGADGKLIGIDKDAAYWEIASQTVLGNTTPEDGLHIAHSMWADMSTERLARLDPDQIATLLDKVDEISPAAYRAYLEPHLDILLAHPTAPKVTRDELRDLIMRRKLELRADFNGYYRRQLANLTDPLPARWQAWVDEGGKFREAVPRNLPQARDLTADELLSLRERALDARKTVQDVLDGNAQAAISWTAAHSSTAVEHDLLFRKLGGMRIYAADDAALDRLSEYLAIEGHRATDDEFWKLLGYAPSDLKDMARYNELKRAVYPTEPVAPLPRSVKKMADQTPSTGKKYKGVSEKQILADKDGTEYLVKSPRLGAKDAGVIKVELAANDLAARLGLNVTPVGITTDGRSIQRIIPNARTNFELAELTDDQIRELADQQVFDFLVGNVDAHAGQFLVDDTGALIGIDKDVAFWGAPEMASPTDHFLHNIWSLGEGDPAMATMYPYAAEQALRARGLNAIRPDQIAAMLDRVDAMTDAEYLRIIKPLLPSLAKDTFKGSYDNAVDWQVHLLSRKQNLRHDVEGYYSKVIERIAADEPIPADWQAFVPKGFGEPRPVPPVIAADVGAPLVAIPAPDVAWFKPGDNTLYALTDSPLPLNTAPVPWSGLVPGEPALPAVKASKEEIDAARAASQKARITYEDVVGGRAPVAWSWHADDAKKARAAGLVVEEIDKGAYVIARGESDLKPLRDYLFTPSRSVDDDAFWHLLGYKDKDLDIIDAAYDIARGKRLSAGVMIVEPDGRVWVMAPRNKWAGYENTVIKGGVESGETPAAAAVREAFEESGISVELDSYLGDYANSDGTGITRMYVAHRVGGGPGGAKFKETFQMRLVTPDEAKGMLTRYGKPDARDQAILADTLGALDGTGPAAVYAVPADDAAEFAAKLTPVQGTPPGVAGEGPKPPVHYGLNPVSVEPRAASEAFHFDGVAVKKQAGSATDTPPATAFPMWQTRIPLADGTKQPFFWKLEATGPQTTIVPLPVLPEIEAVISKAPPAPVAPTPVWNSPKAMVADLTKRYADSNSTFTDLLQIPFEVAKPLMEEVDRIFTQFGHVPSFRGVKFYTGKPGVLAEVARAVPDVPGSYVLLPKAIWTDAEKVKDLAKHGAITAADKVPWGTFAAAKTTEDYIKMVLAHEVGHEYMGLHLYSRFGVKGDQIRADVDAWFAKYRKTYGANPITQYSKNSVHEAWAEAFAAAVGVVPIDDPRINELRDILSAYVAAAPAPIVPLGEIQPALTAPLKKAFAEYFDFESAGAMKDHLAGIDITLSTYATNGGNHLTVAQAKALGKQADLLADAAAGSRTSSAILYRGEAQQDAADLLAAYPEGKTISLPTLTSATEDPAIAGIYTDLPFEPNPAKAIIEIRDPEGVRGVRRIDTAEDNREVILPKGASFRVASVTEESPLNYRIVLEAEPMVEEAPEAASAASTVVNRLFWANSKKQAADPVARFEAHVAQLVHLGDTLTADATIAAVRVNATLLDQVPQLRELLVSAGGQNSKSYLDISRDEFLALAHSIQTSTPLPVEGAAFQTAEMVPSAKAVTAVGDVPMHTMQSLTDNAIVTEDGGLSGHTKIEWRLPAHGTDVPVTLSHYGFTGSGAVIVQKLTWGVAGGAEMRDLAAAHLYMLAGQLRKDEGYSKIILHNSLTNDDTRALLKAMGGSTSAISEAPWLSREDLLAWADKVDLDYANAGAGKVAWSLAGSEVVPTPVQPAAASALAAEVGYSDAAASGYKLGLHESIQGDLSIVMTGPTSGAMTAKWTEGTGTIRWSGLAGDAKGVERNAAVARTLSHLADRADLDPSLSALRISAPLAKKIGSDWRTFLLGEGATVYDSAGALTVPADVLKQLGANIRAPWPKPISNLAPGPLDEVLDYAPGALPVITSQAAVDGDGLILAGNFGRWRLLDGPGNGKILRQWSNVTGVGVPPPEAMKLDELAIMAYLGTHLDANVTRLLIRDSGSLTDLLVARGATRKAEQWVLERQQAVDLASEIGQVPVGAAVPPAVAPAYDAAVAAPAASSEALHYAESAVDEKVTFALVPMTSTTYPKGGAAIWRRLGNVLEVHAIGGADAVTNATLVRMAKAMDAAPKISALRFATNALVPNPAAEALLKSAGGKLYSGGIKLTREQVLAMRDQIMAGVTPEAKAVATGKKAVYGPANSGLMGGDLPVIVKVFGTDDQVEKWAAKTFTTMHMTADHTHAVDDYIKGSGGINNALRSGSPVNATVGKQVALIDEVLNQQPLPDMIRVHRGISFASLTDNPYALTSQQAIDDLISSLIDTSLTEPGFMSTTLGPNWKDIAAIKKADVVLNLRVPAGTPSWYADIITGSAEHELLIGRGQLIHISGAKKVVNRWEIDAEILAPGPAEPLVIEAVPPMTVKYQLSDQQFDVPASGLTATVIPQKQGFVKYAYSNGVTIRQRNLSNVYVWSNAAGGTSVTGPDYTVPGVRDAFARHLIANAEAMAGNDAIQGVRFDNWNQIDGFTQMMLKDYGAVEGAGGYTIARAELAQLGHDLAVDLGLKPGTIVGPAAGVSGVVPGPLSGSVVAPVDAVNPGIATIMGGDPAHGGELLKSVTPTTSLSDQLPATIYEYHGMTTLWKKTDPGTIVLASMVTEPGWAMQSTVDVIAWQLTQYGGQRVILRDTVMHQLGDAGVALRKALIEAGAEVAGDVVVLDEKLSDALALALLHDTPLPAPPVVNGLTPNVVLTPVTAGDGSLTAQLGYDAEKLSNGVTLPGPAADQSEIAGSQLLYHPDYGPAIGGLQFDRLPAPGQVTGEEWEAYRAEITIETESQATYAVLQGLQDLHKRFDTSFLGYPSWDEQGIKGIRLITGWQVHAPAVYDMLMAAGVKHVPTTVNELWIDRRVLNEIIHHIENNLGFEAPLKGSAKAGLEAALDPIALLDPSGLHADSAAHGFLIGTESLDEGISAGTILNYQDGGWSTMKLAPDQHSLDVFWLPSVVGDADVKLLSAQQQAVATIVYVADHLPGGVGLVRFTNGADIDGVKELLKAYGGAGMVGGGPMVLNVEELGSLAEDLKAALGPIKVEGGIPIPDTLGWWNAEQAGGWHLQGVPSDLIAEAKPLVYIGPNGAVVNAIAVEFPPTNATLWAAVNHGSGTLKDWEYQAGAGSAFTDLLYVAAKQDRALIVSQDVLDIHPQLTQILNAHGATATLGGLRIEHAQVQKLLDEMLYPGAVSPEAVAAAPAAPAENLLATKYGITPGAAVQADHTSQAQGFSKLTWPDGASVKLRGSAKTITWVGSSGMDMNKAAVAIDRIADLLPGGTTGPNVVVSNLSQMPAQWKALLLEVGNGAMSGDNGVVLTTAQWKALNQVLKGGIEFVPSPGGFEAMVVNLGGDPAVLAATSLITEIPTGAGTATNWLVPFGAAGSTTPVKIETIDGSFAVLVNTITGGGQAQQDAAMLKFIQHYAAGTVDTVAGGGTAKKLIIGQYHLDNMPWLNNLVTDMGADINTAGALELSPDVLKGILQGTPPPAFMAGPGAEDLVGLIDELPTESLSAKYGIDLNTPFATQATVQHYGYYKQGSVAVKWFTPDADAAGAAMYGAAGSLSKSVNITYRNYVARLVIRNMNYGTPEQRVQAMWLALRELAKTGNGKALYIHGDLTRELQPIKKILDAFGAKKKDLKVGKFGLGYELDKVQAAKLYEALLNDAVAIPTAPGAGATLSHATAAANAAPLPAAVVPPPPVSTLGTVYGFDHAGVGQLLKPTEAGMPGPVLTPLSQTPLTQSFQIAWGNDVIVKYAEEQQGAARILRVRAVSGGAGGTAQANALIASIRDQLTIHLDEHPTVARLVIDKKALTGSPTLASLLSDAGWKETKEYWVADRLGVKGLVQSLADNTATWMADSAIPPPLAATGASYTAGAAISAKGGPKAAPSFIYDYNAPAVHQQLAILADAERVDETLQAGAVGHALTGGGATAQWSVSPSGKTVGWSGLSLPPGATPEQASAVAFAQLRYIAAEASTKDGFFWVKPDVYDQVPGMRQMLVDAGGIETSYAKLGPAIQMEAPKASVIVAAIDGDVMTGLKVSVKTTSDYLGYDPIVATEVLASEPVKLAKSHRWTIGENRADIAISTTDAGQTLVITGVGVTDESARLPAVIGELYWAAQEGLTKVRVGSDVLGTVPKLDKFLLAVGGKYDAATSSIILDSAAINTARKMIGKDVLPVLLGGAKLPYSVVDELNTTVHDVIAHAHAELTSAKGLGQTTRYTVEGKTVEMAWKQSGSNLYWEKVTRIGGGADDFGKPLPYPNVGQLRAASTAQLRSFLNTVAQNASLSRLDIDPAVMREFPALRDMLTKYGAQLMPATPQGPGYLTIERAKVLKLRKDLDAELSTVSATGASYIEQQAALINWPSAEELMVSDTPLAKGIVAQGQTRKAVYVDAQGNEWLFKPGASGRGAVTDRAVAEIAELLGLPVPPVRLYTLDVDGKPVQGSLAKLIPGGKGMREAATPSPEMLSPAQTEDMIRQSILDWVVNNDDAHVGNWMVDDSGHLWAIDKTRSWATFHGAHDTLNTASEGNGGGTPWLFLWLRKARQDPSLLSKIHPTTFASTLRKLEAISEEQFRAIVDPVARLSALPGYKGKAEKMVADMVARKREAATDLQRFFVKELNEIAKAGPLPAEWATWLKKGEFNLQATAKDLWMEEKAALEARFGVWTYDKGHDLMEATHLGPVRNIIRSYFQSGVAGSGSGKYGAELIRARLRQSGKEGLIEEWEALNRWSLLSSMSAETTGTGSFRNFDEVRRFWNPETGTIRVVRTTNRYGTDPDRYLAEYGKIGMRDMVGTSVGRVISVAGGRGVILYMDVPYQQVFSQYTMGYGAGAGEAEFLIGSPRVDQIVHIRRYDNQMPLDQLMGYTGPVVMK